MATTSRRSQIAALAVLAILAGAAARPQVFGFGIPATTAGPGRRGGGDRGPKQIGGGSATPGPGAADAERTNSSVVLLGASTTLGSCPSGASLLLSEEAVRRPLRGVRVSTVLRYDGRGCFGERDCIVSCVKVEAPHKEWRPSSAQISGGRLGGSGIQVTLLSPVGRGYSVRVLIYGRCYT